MLLSTKTHNKLTQATIHKRTKIIFCQKQIRIATTTYSFKPSRPFSSAKNGPPTSLSPASEPYQVQGLSSTRGPGPTGVYKDGYHKTRSITREPAPPEFIYSRNTAQAPTTFWNLRQEERCPVGAGHDEDGADNDGSEEKAAEEASMYWMAKAWKLGCMAKNVL